MSALGGKGPAVIACLTSECFIILACIVGRFYVRHFIKGKIGPDDYVLIATWILHATFTALFIVSSMHGFGQHVSMLSAENLRIATKIELAGQTTVSLAMGLSKTAAALFLMRIVIRPWQRWFLWFWIASMNFLSILLGVVVFAQCYPVQSLWDSRVAAESCPINMTNVAYVMCSWSAAMDFVLAIFPWYFLWDLKMKKKEKITICTSLSLGVMAGVCGIYRTVGLYVLSNAADYLYATAPSVMWTSSELCVTVLCICIPAFRPLWQRWAKGYVEHSSGDDYYNQSGNNKSFSRTLGTNNHNLAGKNNTMVRSRAVEEDTDSDSGIHGSGDNKGVHDSDNSYQLETVVRGGRGHGNGQMSTGDGSWYEGGNKGDDESDKSILTKSKGPMGGIHRVQEISVSYENGGSK